MTASSIPAADHSSTSRRGTACGSGSSTPPLVTTLSYHLDDPFKEYQLSGASALAFTIAR